VKPIGGHGVLLDAAAILAHIPRDEFHAQAVAAAIYLDSGVRGIERSNDSAVRDPVTGENRHPKLELVGLTIPRRVYTQSHIDVVAESVIEVYEQAETITGLQFTYEPESLRFFQAEFSLVR